MASFLVFHLYGPMAAWGEIAVGEVRPSERRPTRSALLGLLAAALGLRRSEEEAQGELARGLRFAVRVDRAGVPISDYHTAQVQAPRRGFAPATRAEQLAARRDDLETILSRREYRCDAAYTVAAWRAEESGPTLDALAAALQRPVFPLYLGRKSCPLAWPLGAQVLEAANLPDLLGHFGPPLELGDSRAEPLWRLKDGPNFGLFWEGDPPGGGLEPLQVEARRDDPVSVGRREFRVRRERFAPWPLPTPAKENSDVPLPVDPKP